MECRICSNTNSMDLIVPCKCEPTHVHRRCLDSKRRAETASRCKQCDSEYLLDIMYREITFSHLWERWLQYIKKRLLRLFVGYLFVYLSMVYFRITPLVACIASALAYTFCSIFTISYAWKLSHDGIQSLFCNKMINRILIYVSVHALIIFTTRANLLLGNSLYFIAFWLLTADIARIAKDIMPLPRVVDLSAV